MAAKRTTQRKRGRPPGAVPIERDPQRFEIACWWAFVEMGLGQFDAARRALLAERSRVPQSLQARDAAFFLGGLAESSGDDGAALSWYETYLGESPSGTYAPQALGRKMMIARRVRGIRDARAVAAEYLRRFGEGPYAPSARAILSSP